MRKKKKVHRGLSRRNARLGYLFTAPWVIGFLTFTLFPLGYSLYMSTQKVTIGADGVSAIPVGFKNFSYAVTMDFNFLMATWDTIRSVMILTPLVIVLALILALMLNQKMKMRGIFRAIYFLPVIILSGSLMNALEQNGAFSVVNLTESAILRWLSNANLGVLFTVIQFLIDNIFTVLWFSGVQILIYLSGLQKNTRSVYEAANIDGASAWQTFWAITFPAMNQFTLLNVVYTVVLLASFPTSPVIELIRQTMFAVGDYQGLGYTSAISWIYFLVILLMLLVFMVLLRSRSEKRGKRNGK